MELSKIISKTQQIFFIERLLCDSWSNNKRVENQWFSSPLVLLKPRKVRYKNSSLEFSCGNIIAFLSFSLSLSSLLPPSLQSLLPSLTPFLSILFQFQPIQPVGAKIIMVLHCCTLQLLEDMLK